MSFGINAASHSEDLTAYLDSRVGEMLSACTRCGKCVEICPVVPFSKAAGQNTAQVVSGVLDHLAAIRPPSESSADWMHRCNGCGDCIPACPESVNPQQLLLMAAIKESSQGTRTPHLFRRMSRAVKLMVAMQLLPVDFARLLSTPKSRPVDLIFYTGCNAPRTPHLLFNTMYVLDALGADYEVLGGPSSCCGVIAAKWEGEVRAGGRMSTNTLTRFASFQPSKVLNWCPTCDIHLNTTLDGFGSRSFDFEHVTKYFLGREADLRNVLSTPVQKRVVLHAHRGSLEVSRNVESLLSLVPGLQIVETVFDASYTCGRSGSAKTPELREKEQAHLLGRVKESGADALITLFHSCHMALLGYEKTAGIEVLNFTDILAQAAGRVPSTDRLKHFRLLDDWPAIVEDVRPFLKMNGLEIDLKWLEENGARLISLAEFSSDFDCVQANAIRSD